MARPKNLQAHSEMGSASVKEQEHLKLMLKHSKKAKKSLICIIIARSVILISRMQMMHQLHSLLRWAVVIPATWLPSLPSACGSIKMEYLGS